MNSLLLWTTLLFAGIDSASASVAPAAGVASWYGEDDRGRLMANPRN